MKFTELELEAEILKALKEIGYEDMTPIQELTMPHIVAGRDLLGLAETGSGKTGACAVPLIQRVDATTNAIQVLILVPTRELALQYVTEIASIATHTDVVPFAVFGGFDMGIQRAKLRHGVHILVATPGRLIDFLWNTDLVDLTKVHTVVLDEADEMLKMGFVEDIDFIMACMVHEHETLLFSATMPTEIDRLASTYLRDPVRVELNKDQRAPQSLTHNFEHVGRGRFESLIQYLNSEKIAQAIVFCNSRVNGSDLMNSLKKQFTSVEYIHGGLDQDRRISIFNRFRSKKIKFMVATDVAGRGLDFSHVSHVINYDFPPSSEIYTHRTGRTGRMGREGTAMTFVANRDLDNLRSILKANRIEPDWRGDEPSLDGGRKQAASGGRTRPPRRRRPPRPEQKSAPTSNKKRER